MSLLVTGSIGIDTVTTPFGRSKDCLGGSAVYFSMAASHFCPVRFVGAVGGDSPFDLKDIFAGRDVDLSGLEVRPESKTFRWQGSYAGDMSNAVTDFVELNVLTEAPPALPKKFTDSKYVFLANTHPRLQMELLEQLAGPEFVAADTMNCWIENHAEELKALLRRIDALIVNQAEAQMITQQDNLAAAVEELRNMGPKVVIVKKGEHGSVSIDAEGSWIVTPGFPSTQLRDPTGAGDSFAGAMMGYLASKDSTDNKTLKKAIAFGTVTASLAIEGFSLSGISDGDRDKIDRRFEMLRHMTEF